MSQSFTVNTISGLFRSTPSIHDAVKDGDVKLVEELARKLGHSEVDVCDEDGWTPLHLATLKGSTEVVKVLLKYGADVNAVAILKRTPLHCASRSVALLVLDLGKTVARDAICPMPLLNIAINLTHSLVEQGAILEQKMYLEGTPLFVASKENQLEPARLLLKSNANVNTVCRGKSPLSVAAECGHLDMVKLLVENGANLNQFEFNQSPLYLAIENNHTEVTKFLIQQNAFVSLTDVRMKALVSKFGGKCCYEFGKTCVSENDTMAAYWFRFAAELGYQPAYSPFASMLLEGRGITRSFVNAESWFCRASQVDAQHCFTFGESFLTGINGVICDYDKAFYWLKQAAESDTGSDVSSRLSLSQSTTTKLELGKLYLNGRGTLINYVEADRWLGLVENKVDAGTSYKMAYAFTTTGTNQNYEKAFLWLKRAVDHKSGLSSFQLNIAKQELGKLYLHGNGTSKDILEAERLLQGLSEVDAATKFTMGLVFLSQDGQHQDYGKAFNWLKKALEVEPTLAPNKLNSARLELGKLYLHVNGTDCNLDVADDLFRG
ncbi:hypothetical protein HDU79_001389 [Rhizoclosmatium sp. JEL0117]|nr:hypothetical protein HDU79_001389 [Rhizoclosmatium sp. JEL0117]